MKMTGSPPSLNRAVTLQIVLLTLFASVLVFESASSLQSSMRGMDHANQVIGAERELIKLNVDMETGLRGFLITGDAIFLQPYNEAAQIIEARFDLLDRLVAENPSERTLVAGTRSAYEQWRLQAAGAIEQRRGSSATSSDQLRDSRMLDRKAAMDAIRAKYQVLISGELLLRDRDVQRVKSRSMLLSGGCLLFAIVGGVGLWFILRRQVRLHAIESQKAVDAERLVDLMALKIARRDKDEAVANYRGQIEAIDRSQMMIEFNMDGTIIRANDNVLRRFGYKQSDLEGKHHSVILSPEDKGDTRQEEFWAELREGKFQSGEFRRVGIDGREVWVEVRYTPIFGSDGVPFRVVAFATDETERVRNRLENEARIRDAEARLRVIVDNVPAGIIVIDKESRITSVNPAALRLFGYEAGELAGKDIAMLMPLMQQGPDEEHLPGDPFAGTAEGIGIGLELEGRTKGGGLFPFELTVTEASFHGEGWRILLIQDITEIKRADGERRRYEEGLRKTQALLEQTGKLAGVGGWEVDLITNKVTWAAETYRLLDADRSYEPTLAEAIDLYTPESKPLITAALQRAAAGGGGWDLELSLRTRSGRIIWARVVGAAELVDGQPVRLTGAFQDITARIAERRALQHANKRAALATNSGGIGIWDWDLESGEFTCDDWIYRLFGLEREADRSYDLNFWAGRLHPEDRAACEQALMECIEGVSPYDTEFRNVWDDGSIHHIKAAGQVSRDQNGKAVRMVGTNFDITERRLQLEALRKSENFLERTGRIAGIGGWEFDLETGRVSWSSETYHIHGVEPGFEPDFATGLDFFAPADRPAIQEAIENGAAGGGDWDMEVGLNRADGRSIVVRLAGSGEFVDGKAVRLVGTVQDITARVAERRALQDANSRAALATESGGIGIWDWDLKTNTLTYDARMFRLRNLDPTDAAICEASAESGFWARYVHPEDAAAVEKALSDAIDGVKTYDTEYRVVWDDGSVHHVKASGIVTRDQTGAAVRIVGTSFDITARIAEQNALVEANRRVAVANESGGIGIWDWDIPADNLTCDALMYRLYGMKPVDTRKFDFKFWADRVHPDDRAGSDRALQDCVDGIRPFDAEFRIVWDDGSVHHIKATGQMSRNEQGQATRVVGTNVDITERKHAEEELRKSQAFLEQTGRLAGVGGWEIDLQSQKVTWGPETCRILGADLDFQPTFDELFSRFSPLSRPLLSTAIERAEATGEGWDLELSITAVDGRQIWARMVGTVEFAGDRPVRLRGAFQDITRLVGERLALAEANERTTLATDSGGIGIFDRDLETNKLTTDPWMRRLYGLSPEAAEAFDHDFWMGHMHPQDREGARQALQDASEGGQPYHDEFRIVWDDGSVHHIRATGRVTCDKLGHYVRMVGTNMDITAGKEAEELLRQGNEKEQQLIRGMKDYAILTLDTEGRVTTWNEGAKRIKGYSAEEILGCHFSKFYTPDDIAIGKPWRELEVAREQGRNEDQGLRVRKDGSLFWADVLITALYDDDGLLRGFGKVTRDVSERKRNEEAAEKALLQAELANRAKSDFLANMSHEVRTPVNAIMGMAHLALRADPSEKQQSYLTKIDKAARSLLNIMNDILDYSKIEAGKLTLERIDFSLDEVLKNLVEIVGHRARRKGLPIVFSIAPEVPRSLSGDPLRLGQVLINLVNNAIKFADRGEVVLKIIVEKESSPGHLCFSVCDSGIGMTPEQVANLFQSFTQADTSFTRKYGGTGLGLAISKQLCELMGGKISVQSEIGVGSTFSFTTAFGVAAEAPPVPLRNYLRNTQDEKQTRNILIVDDSELTRELLVQLLNTRDYASRCVASGEEALSALTAAEETGKPFDLVIMDWRLPGINGIETSRRIKAHRPLSRVPPILVISAFDREEVFSGADNLALDGYLIKPVGAAQLFHALDGIFAKIVGLTPPAEFPVGTELKGRRVLLVEDNDMNIEVATELLRDLGIVVSVALNGREGVDRVAAQPFDLVLMDIQMPVMDGLTATRLIRSDPRNHELPILAMTAHAMSGDHQRSLDAGMSDHVTKPIDFVNLTRTLIKWMPSEQPPVPQQGAQLGSLS
jgi:PAS domain S-box-containing protein